MPETPPDTGLLRAAEIAEDNLKGFLEILTQTVAAAAEEESSLTLCLLREDNQVFYYPCDQAQKSLIPQMIRVLREDAGVKGLINAWGYEELSIIFERTEPAQARVKAERVREVLADSTFWRDGQPVRITFSLGLASYPQDGDQAAAIFNTAAGACKAAFDSGGNRVFGEF